VGEGVETGVMSTMVAAARSSGQRPQSYTFHTQVRWIHT
jgi:hypothetical protein